MFEHKNMFVYNNYNEFALDSYNYIKGNDIIAFISSIYEIIYWIRLEIIWKKLNVEFISSGGTTTAGEPKGSVKLVYHAGEDIITTLPAIPDTDRITSMNNFLKEYPYIENINLDTINLTSLNNAFANSNLHSITINTHDVINYKNAFANCNIDNLIIDFYSIRTRSDIYDIFEGSTISNLEILNGNEDIYVGDDCNINIIKYINGSVYIGKYNIKSNDITAKSVYLNDINDIANIVCDNLYIVYDRGSTNIDNVLNCKTKNIIFNESWFNTELNIIFDLTVLQNITILNNFTLGVIKSNINLNDISEDIFILNKEHAIINNVFNVDSVNIDLINRFNFLPLFCTSVDDETKGADINIDLSDTNYIINAPRCYKFPNNTYIKGKINKIAVPTENVEKYIIINTYTIHDNVITKIDCDLDDISENCKLNGIFNFKNPNFISYIYNKELLRHFENIDSSINTYIGNCWYKYKESGEVERFENYCITNKIKLFTTDIYNIGFTTDHSIYGGVYIDLEKYIIKNDKITNIDVPDNGIINIDNVNVAVKGRINYTIFISSKNNMSVKVISVKNSIPSLFLNNKSYGEKVPDGYYLVNTFDGDITIYIWNEKSIYTNIIVTGTVYLVNKSNIILPEDNKNVITDITCKSLILEDNDCYFCNLINLTEDSINNMLNVLVNNSASIKTITIYRTQYNKLHEDTITNVLNKNYQFSIREN